jgi:aspartyl-tRNA(Asn)/glutamyl-tRNA(Gln) amidotransferase subunit B
VDFNRAGTGLMELVSEPDIRTPEEARRFATSLRLIFMTLGISDCNMEEGSMRVDANVSVRPRGTEAFGTKAEVKNMNSFKAVHDALAHEIVRQADLLDAGGTVDQETRHWDAAAKRTSSLRGKEEAHDYRYFPEPDMVPFEIGDVYVEALRAGLPELPDARKARLAATFGLSAHQARVLGEDPELEAYYAEAVEDAGIEYAKPLANWVLGEVSAQLNVEGIRPWGLNVSARKLARIVQLVADGTISGKQAKEVFAEICETGEKPLQVVERLGMKQVSDAGELEEVVDRVLAANPAQVEGYRSGKTGLLGFFVGAIMRETGGQANPAVVNELLARKLG